MYGTPENPLFLAKEVAACIEHSNITVMLQSVDEDEKMKITPKQSLGDLVNYKEYNFLTEYGLYEVLMQSRKPIAKQFKKGIKLILHEIRMTGSYSTSKPSTPVLTNIFDISNLTGRPHARIIRDIQKILEQGAGIDDFILRYRPMAYNRH